MKTFERVAISWGSVYTKCVKITHSDFFVGEWSDGGYCIARRGMLDRGSDYSHDSKIGSNLRMSQYPWAIDPFVVF